MKCEIPDAFDAAIFDDGMKSVLWTQQQAVELCWKIEHIAPTYGAHVALTGGCLYKKEERKDVDILFYRIRQVEKIDVEGLFLALQQILGIYKESGFGWVYKAKYENKPIDFFFPEEDGGCYEDGNKS